MKITKKIQHVNCEFRRVPFGEGFCWYLIATRRRKQIVGKKIQMVTLEVRGNSLWGEDSPRSERHDLLRSGELPDYQIFAHVFRDFCNDPEKKLRSFL